MQQPAFRPLAFETLDGAQMRARCEAFRLDMARRRTVRDFSDAPVPRDIIETAVMTAAGAPSGANQQPWQFVAIADPALKRTIREGAEAEEREFYERRATPEWLDALAPLGTDHDKTFLETAPWLIAIFYKAYDVEADGTRTKLYYPIDSTGIATGFLIAALHQAGLACLTHTPSPMAFLNQILDRPANERPFVLLVVGYPATDATVPSIERKPLEAIATFR